MGRVYNFAAGPAVLPLEVLEKAGREITDWHGTGMSVMEMSHRSKAFQEIFNHTKDSFRRILNVPNTHEILFLQGGGSTQFSMVPLNLMSRTGKADYAVTGHFSDSAAKEARKYGDVHLVYDGTQEGFHHIPVQSELHLDPGASYVHICMNNTIYGTEWNYIPDTGDVPLVADMSSDIASKPIDFSKFGLVYAGAQKNMAPAGVTIVIIRKDLAGHEMEITPLMLSYEREIKKDSMFNTPPCWQIYMLGLVLDWIEEQGGLTEMEKRRNLRSEMLYKVLDNSHLYIGQSDKQSRSKMNVTFRTGDKDLDTLFVNRAAEDGLVNLKGHRLVGGMRASIYNAMSMEGVERLCDFMIRFEKENGNV